MEDGHVVLPIPIWTATARIPQLIGLGIVPLGDSNGKAEMTVAAFLAELRRSIRKGQDRVLVSVDVFKDNDERAVRIWFGNEGA